MPIRNKTLNNSLISNIYSFMSSCVLLHAKINMQEMWQPFFMAYYGQNFKSRRFAQRYLHPPPPHPLWCKYSLHAPSALATGIFSIGRKIVIVGVHWLLVQRVSFLLVFKAKKRRWRACKYYIMWSIGSKSVLPFNAMSYYT